MARYDCTPNGRCEVSVKGFYETKEECVANCRGLSEDKDSLLLAYQYAPISATRDLNLADQSELLRLLTRVNANLSDVSNILIAYGNADWHAMAQYDILLPWVRLNYPGPRTFDVGLANEMRELRVTGLEYVQVYLRNTEFPFELLEPGDLIRFVRGVENVVFRWTGTNLVTDNPLTRALLSTANFPFEDLQIGDYFYTRVGGNEIARRSSGVEVVSVTKYILDRIATLRVSRPTLTPASRAIIAAGMGPLVAPQ